jgi:hypothetical protein
MIFITYPEAQTEAPTEMLQRLSSHPPKPNSPPCSPTAKASPKTPHLKPLFQKTSTNRQSELVKLILNSPVVLK